MPILDIRATGIRESGKGLDALARAASDLRPFWSELDEDLADTAQARWPLRRRTGKLRRSLTWRGETLGRGGVFEPTPDRFVNGRRELTNSRHSSVRSARAPVFSCGS